MFLKQYVSLQSHAYVIWGFINTNWFIILVQVHGRNFWHELKFHYSCIVRFQRDYRMAQRTVISFILCNFALCILINLKIIALVRWQSYSIAVLILKISVKLRCWISLRLSKLWQPSFFKNVSLLMLMLLIFTLFASNARYKFS